MTLLTADALGWIASMKCKKQRCIFENDDIMVVHNFVTYTSGSQHANLATSMGHWKATSKCPSLRKGGRAVPVPMHHTIGCHDNSLP